MRNKVKKYLRWSLIGAFVLLVLSYGFLRTKDMIMGPQIEIFELTDGQLLNEEFLTLEGQIDNSTQVLLNGRKIFLDDEGRFAEQLLLLEGYNIIRVEATDRFDQTTTETIQLIYKPQ